MAIDIGIENVALSIQERTWRVELFCELGEDPSLVAHREKLWLRSNGTVAQRDRNIPPVRRKLSAIASKSIAGITGAQVAEKIAAWADGLRQEDITAGVTQ